MNRFTMFILMLAFGSMACFMPAKTITPTQAITPAQVNYIPQPTNTQQPQQAVCTVNAESLNIRTAPEGLEESKVLGWLYAGDLATITEARGAWFKVTARGFNGWIKKTYCSQGK